MTTNQFFSPSGLSEQHHAKPRLIHEIARDIRLHWANVYYGAEPYLRAMETLYTVKDSYGCDDAKGILNYFLANAQGFRGDHARRLKAELKELLPK